MKIWITEYADNTRGILIGPYIKADSIEKANRIAIQYGLIVLGEIQELIHEAEEESVRMVH